MSFSKKIENKFLFIEKGKHYKFLEGKRCEVISDTEMVEFGILCAAYSTKTKDWRFVNLALKILDSEVVLADKSILENEIVVSIKHLQNQIL